MSIGIFYGSNGGVTEGVAEMIKDKLGLDADLHDISDVDMDKFHEYSHIIIGTSTWGDGELQDDWDNCFEDFETVSFAGKTLAFFGTGDQDGYEDNFVDGMGILYKVAINNGAFVVGDGWSTESYDFDESVAVEDDAFVGLAIDDDNQDDLTEGRVEKWVETIKPHFA